MFKIQSVICVGRSLSPLLFWVLLCPALVLSQSLPSDGTLVPVVEGVLLSSAQNHVQQTPIATHNGAIYVAFLEPSDNGKDGGIVLRTSIMKGLEKKGEWVWTKRVIDSQTVHDRWHTAPAIGIDDRGFIHVAYNMHNLPWQYQISDKSESIGSFNFKGQIVSVTELQRMKFKNKTDFPTLGSAAIPGNQITYPAFFNDNNGKLFVSYRFAAKPARKFANRTMSSGVAKYDSNAELWQAIGGKVVTQPGDFEPGEGITNEVSAIASTTGWTSYFPRLSFGPEDTMNINWFWRKGIAAATLHRPCFIKTHDHENFVDSKGHTTQLPSTPDNCRDPEFQINTTFNGIGNSVANSKGDPFIVLSPVGSNRQILSLKNGRWTSEDSPHGATEVFFDNDDNLWAVAAGPKIFVKPHGATTKNESNWKEIYLPETKTHCSPRVVLNQAKNRAFLYTQRCHKNVLDIFEINLKKH